MDTALSFQDVFKKSILSIQNTLNLSIFQILVILSITLAVSLFIFMIYKITFDGVVYSHSFSVSLVLLSLVTALIIMTISSNIVLSLGMVGALSIVRFRAAIKDPKDIVFQFWSISVGIATGASLYALAVVGSLFIGAVLIILAKTKFSMDTYLLIVKYDSTAKAEVLQILNTLNRSLKSKTCVGPYIEETFELKKVGENTSFVETLCQLEAVESAILVKYNGDYAQ